MNTDSYYQLCAARCLQHFQQGVSLLEILIALVITAVGLLGFASLQARALLSTEDAYVRTQAMTFAQDMLERMRANNNGDNVPLSLSSGMAVYAAPNNWTGGISASLNCQNYSARCSPEDMAADDIADLRQAIEDAHFLPNGAMMVDTAHCGQQVCVYVAWGETTIDDCVMTQAKAQGLKRLQCVVVTGN